MSTKNIGIMKMARKVAVSMPPITPVPIACWLAEPAPLPIASGSTPRTNASDVIRIGRNRSLRRFHRRLAADLPCASQLARELDDQNRVLRRQPDRGQQADLEEHVVFQAAQRRRGSAPSTPSGTTMITENGIDQLSYSAARHRNTTRIESAYRSGACEPGLRFLQRHARPFVADARRQLAHQLLHRRHRLAGAWPGAAGPWISTDEMPL